MSKFESGVLNCGK